MKPVFLARIIVAFLILQTSGTMLRAQSADSTAVPEEKHKNNKPVKDMFESGYLIDNQTALIPTEHTLEFIIQHRFGLLNSKDFDLGGLYAPSNIRIGLNFSITKDLLVGIGTTKNNKLQDITYKYALLKQTRSGSIPVSVTYYGNTVIDVRKDVFPATLDRLSFHNELIIARKFSNKVSVQLAPSFSHFNMVDSTNKHDNIGIAFCGRVKVSEAIAINFEYDQNFTAQNKNAVKLQPTIGIGIEAATSAHVFQVFISSGQAIINQHNILYNTNDFTKNQFCIGFNMTRLWNY